MLFLGRARELERLGQGCDAVLGGRGALHLIVGEPGIGKTRLAEEAATRAADKGVTVAWGRAWETGGAPPFFPWIEVLEALGGEPAGAPNLDASRPSRGDSASQDSAQERFAIFDRVTKFLRERSRKAPLLLVLDDLHAADVPSLELLLFVARSLRSLRIAIVGTLRDIEAQRAPFAELLARIGREGAIIPLGALGTDDVAKLVEEHTGHADSRLTADLVEKTDGNPLFVSEALRMLDQGSLLGPSSLLSLVASRTQGLAPEVSELLDTAAVFGRRIVVSSLAGATDMAAVEVARRLGDLASRGILRAGDAGSYVFSHALIREVFYERVPPERRRELHRAIAMALRSEGQKYAALTAHHLLAAVPLASAREIVEASIIAAEAARARLAPEDALTLLEKAEAVVGELDASESSRIELMLALGWAATEAGALARGRQVFREASQRAARAGDAELAARAALGQGAELVFGEVRDELIVTLRSALIGLGESVDLEARLLARLAAALQPSTTPDEPVALARRAMQMVKDVSAPRLRAEIALAAGSALTDFAPPAERVPVAEELIASARSLGDAVLELRGLTRLATDWLELGDFARAEGVIDARAELAASIGHPRYLWQTPLLRSMLAMPKGDFAVCDEAIEEATAIGQEGLDVNAAHVIAMHRFWLCQLRGDTAGLRAHLPEISRAMLRMPEPAQHQALVQAVVHARSGEAEKARRALAGIGDGLRMLAPMMLATIADAALRADDSARFAELWAKLGPARGRNAVWGPFGFICGPPYDVVLGSLEARLGKSAAARASFAAALELTQRSGASASEALVHEARAAALGGETAVVASSPAPVARPVALAAPAKFEFSMRVTDKDAVIECGGRTTRLRLVRGLPMLARLVEQPGQELHVLDLAADADDESAIADRGDAGEVLDAKAREAYQQRIGDLRAEIDDAERAADLGRAERARRELDLLVQQLASAVGLGGRARRVGSAAERARTVVQRRIREAIKKVADHEPELARHLDWAIRTGIFCAYEPMGRKTAGSR